MLIVTVLKQSKEYQPVHAQWLHRQIQHYDSLCLTDSHDISGVTTAPLMHSFPSWWSKLEAFNPSHPILGAEDILLLDIDTVIIGDLEPFLQQKSFTTLTDFYYENSPHRPIGSAVMFIPHEIKDRVWNIFIRNPEKWINAGKMPPWHGDQGFLSSYTNPDRWQDILPGNIISYKKDIASKGMLGWNRGHSVGNGDVPFGARLVCFHGNPRPWEMNLEWVPQL
ncbi:hypothetical protein ACMV5L_01805 [Serratia plymuthica]|uniref:hypothetical protein n=1 Tax=Serratia plymuthica TaxID=82996 RepID=UPI003DA675BA